MNWRRFPLRPSYATTKIYTVSSTRYLIGVNHLEIFPTRHCQLTVVSVPGKRLYAIPMFRPPGGQSGTFER